MKTRIFSAVFCLILIASLLPISALADEKSDNIVILYENDVHCSIDGYSKLSAMKQELQATNKYVGVVSSGDYIQGSSLGVISKGEYVINVINMVGYDALAIGNHEFDYKLPRLFELKSALNTKLLCCNFQEIGKTETVFEPYTIVSYGETDVAYIGVTTPYTISSSFPAQFKDENDNYIYTFNPLTLYDVVQSNIDKAKAAGADYIIGLTHMGYEEPGEYADVCDLISNTSGFDVILDAHSHSTIENMKMTDKDGNEIILSSTGTKFEHIGKLTIANGEITTELIKTATYEKTDSAIDAYIEKITNEFAVLGDRKIAESKVELITHDTDGNRLVRISETNLGDLCADAFKAVTGADIGYVNGGGIRAPLAKGDVTFNGLLSLFPFNNEVAVVEISGQTIKDFLELTLKSYPNEDGSFPHVAGITFSFDTSIPSSVTTDENDLFTGVGGEYRVYNIKVLNKETNEYEPIDLEKKYTFAATSYFLFEYGGGATMFKDATVIENNGMLDVELIEKHLTENLNGVIGEEYETVKPNIEITDGKPKDDTPPTSDMGNTAIYFTVVALTATAAALIASKKNRFSI